MSNPLRPSLPSLLSNDSQNSNSNHTPPNSNGQSSLSQKSPNQSIRLPPISFLSGMSSMSNPHQMAPPSSLGVPRLLNNLDQGQPQQPQQPQGQQPQSGSGYFQTLSNTQSVDHTKISPSIPSISHLTHQQVPQQHQPSHYGQLPSIQSTHQQSQSTETIPTISAKPSFLNQVLPSSSSNSNSNDIQSQAVKLKEEITKPDVEEESDEDIIKYYEKKYGIMDFTNEEKHDILQHEKRARIEKSKNPNYKTYLCYSIIKRLNTIQPKKVDAPQELQQQNPPPKFIKREIIINNEEVLKNSLKFPRKYLGSILYTPFPTRSTYKQLSCFKNLEIDPTQENEIVPLLPNLKKYINSIITIRIPSYQINNLQNNHNYLNRSIWGSDIYTDDSDILLILKHNGFLPSLDNDFENLIEVNQSTEKKTSGNLENKSNIDQTVNNFRHFVNIIGGDIHVDLIILPKLNHYKGHYNNGINSRDWIEGHDGVSIGIFGVKYGEINSSVESINDCDLKKRKIEQIEEMSLIPLEILDNNGKWKLNVEAYKKVKLQLELEKSQKEKKEKTESKESKQ
ncbi:Transcriptional regulatory protein [Wickerhamomyces ciferrii]|uniref:Transcriptional regulatory protein n=1 Tax=Wickerhamomyces ciferrii (strain ATCC 14091 / BCRC 22168 / CBS 111 / JCM 3599 / NBRC 0793 / NRRL Y-1031 F-60-10) TaxID=1206466 RepID=K0KYE9_WICCF|nr:Transcriptional regulatory protein [Wickerhamomyces ciferrii]CCH46118.1 Transcriptional regulatory protein [Wickerhamomyces ciferrii]